MLTVEPTITVTVISIPCTAFSYIILDRFFYRATAYSSICLARYAIARPSVCLSVRPSKTVEVMIMKFPMYGTSTPLVFAG